VVEYLGAHPQSKSLGFLFHPSLSTPTPTCNLKLKQNSHLGHLLQFNFMHASHL
jgi:hypothetical protein